MESPQRLSPMAFANGNGRAVTSSAEPARKSRRDDAPNAAEDGVSRAPDRRASANMARATRSSPIRSATRQDDLANASRLHGLDAGIAIRSRVRSRLDV